MTDFHTPKANPKCIDGYLWQEEGETLKTNLTPCPECMRQGIPLKQYTGPLVIQIPTKAEEQVIENFEESRVEPEAPPQS